MHKVSYKTKNTIKEFWRNFREMPMNSTQLYKVHDGVFIYGTFYRERTNHCRRYFKMRTQLSISRTRK